MIGKVFALKEIKAAIVIQLKKKFNPGKFLCFVFVFKTTNLEKVNDFFYPWGKIPPVLDSEQGLT